MEILLNSTLLVFVLMFFLWILARKWKNVGIIDIGWTLSFPLIAFIAFALGQGAFLQKCLLLFMILFWSLRLAYYLIDRFDRSIEDPRYTRINGGFPLFIFQGCIALVLSAPFMLYFNYATSGWAYFEILGILIWATGLFGETIADRQMHAFKNKNPGKVCDIGLWRYSRHPNYFFEWVIWIGFALFILPSAFGWTSLVSVGIMYYLLRWYSGVPMAEAQALRTKGVAYREYQERTSPFFPNKN